MAWRLLWVTGKRTGPEQLTTQQDALMLVAFTTCTAPSHTSSKPITQRVLVLQVSHDMFATGVNEKA